MCCEGRLGQRCEVIHVIEGRALLLVVASQEEIDVVRSLQTERRFR